jgi:hypothetical protein
VLAWADLLKRTDIQFPTKVVWAIVLLVPIAPVFYVLLSGDLW